MIDSKSGEISPSEKEFAEFYGLFIGRLRVSF